MSGTIWQSKGVKNVEFSRSGDKTEFLFAIALGAVIVLALALTVYFTVIKSDRPAAAAGTGLAMYQCEKCKAEFSVDPQKVADLVDADTMRDRLADCPKCGAKKSAWPMVKCPHCGKYYVRESLRRPSATDVCPYCKTPLFEGLNK